MVSEGRFIQIALLLIVLGNVLVFVDALWGEISEHKLQQIESYEVSDDLKSHTINVL